MLDPANISRAFRDPVTWAALIIDLIPIYAVLVLGWGAVPLVFLYWLENLVIGVMTIARMIASGLGKGGRGIAQIAFMVPFFTIHYGMFCFGHGIGLLALQSKDFAALGSESVSENYSGIVQHASASGPNMLTFIAIIFIFNVFLFFWDYIGKQQFLRAEPSEEMFAPYGRIVLLHVALFAGMFALISFGEPMLGVLSLIILRALWGVFISVHRRLRLDEKVDGAS